MGSYADKWRGRAEALAGKAKERFGHHARRADIEAEGRATRAKGEARQDVSKVKLAARGALDTIIGTVKERFGKVTGNKRYVIEGKQQRLKGQLEQAAR